ncbi:MAG TPA: radical SAM family heme chaperone HemW [Candidatus Marinimicrobia bacterium]|nr:radical SAM family heme chaperone HemW [Candidatus Neomarinimicrobiota bacterium]
MAENLSLYIHFPFCRQKCRYCDFYSEIYNQRQSLKWLGALGREIELYRNFYSGRRVVTLYLGGGSPNLISGEKFVKLMKILKSAFDLNELGEFTVESNPVRHENDFLRLLRENGVNRLNVGVQSFDEDEIRFLGRIHSVEDSIAFISHLQQIGFRHIGLDLIYGIPGQTMASWRRSLETALALPADHLSLYNLTYEKGTPLQRMLEGGQIEFLNSELERQLYLEACRLLAENGFVHYEISNWAKPGAQSQHNQVYWQGSSYLGLGPAAHSFDGKSRWWNVRSVDTYIERLNANCLPIEQQEQLSATDCEIEHLFLQLRTTEGLERRRFENLFHIDFNRLIDRLMQLKIDEEYWQFDDGKFKLTPAGWIVSDAIIYSLLNVIEELRNDHKKSGIRTKRTGG